APAIAPIMWLGVLAGAAAQIAEPAAAPFALLSGPLLVYVQDVAHLSASLPLSVVQLRVSPVVAAGLWSAVVAAVARGIRRMSLGVSRPRRGIALVLAATALVAAGVAHARPAPLPAPGELVVSFLDIGQGDATLIQLDRTAVLVDTGPPDGPILARLRE